MAGLESDQRGAVGDEAASSARGLARGGNGSRTILWCVPRSVSTALTKCLSFVEDTQIWFEPFCYCKMATVSALARGNIHLPQVYEGNEEIYQQTATMFDASLHTKTKAEHLSFSSIHRFLETSTSPHVFVKDMAMVISPQDYKFLPKGYKHTFLIRHPLRVFSSYRKAMYSQFLQQGLLTGDAAKEELFDVVRDNGYVTPTGLLFKDSYDIWKYVRENIDSNPIVIDGDDLLMNPAEVLSKYCRAVGLPYDDSLLKWDASMDVLKKWMFPSEGLLEQLVYVYESAVRSSEFLPAREMPSRDQVTSDVIRYTDEVIKYYEEMYATRLK